MNSSADAVLSSAGVRLGRAGASASLPPIAASLIGGIAWSGVPSALICALLAPPLILSAGTRGSVALRAFCYYAAATWPLVPSAAVFFGEEGPAIKMAASAVLGWLAVALLNTVPWVLVSQGGSSGRIMSLLLGLFLPAVPPLALVGLASPLAGLGLLLPGTGVWGLMAVVMVGAVWVGAGARTRASALAGLAVLTLTAQGVHVRHVPSDDPWLAVSTSRGAPPQATIVASVDAEAIERLRGVVASSSAKVLVLPEGYLRAWSPATDAFLAPLWRRLATDGRSVALGMNRRDPVTGLEDNAVVVRGASRGELSQHYPVPISMYRAGAPGSTPLRLRGPYSLQVGDERIGVVICWEQLLLAPMLQLALESPRPDRLVAVSNLYFARGTPVAHIQRASVAAWARLFGVPYVHAINE